MQATDGIARINDGDEVEISSKEFKYVQSNNETVSGFNMMYPLKTNRSMFPKIMHIQRWDLCWCFNGQIIHHIYSLNCVDSNIGSLIQNRIFLKAMQQFKFKEFRKMCSSQLKNANELKIQDFDDGVTMKVRFSNNIFLVLFSSFNVPFESLYRYDTFGLPSPKQVLDLNCTFQSLCILLKLKHLMPGRFGQITKVICSH